MVYRAPSNVIAFPRTRGQREATDDQCARDACGRGLWVGGSPWIGFAICAPVAIVLSFPQHLDVLARYYGHPKTDIALMILMYFGLVSLGAFASAWVGYFLALLLKP